MGWCSGTSIFDEVMKWVEVERLDQTHPPSRKHVVSLLVALTQALENEDWDCHWDSAYLDHPLVKEAWKTIHPDWFPDIPDPVKDRPKLYTVLTEAAFTMIKDSEGKAYVYGRRRGLTGALVWQTPEEAEQFIQQHPSLPLKVYSIWADWEEDTMPCLENPSARELIRSKVIIESLENG